jgi:hypothetical protein
MTVADQNWTYIPETYRGLQIIYAMIFWILLYNFVMLIPLPKYKTLKNAEGKPIEVTKAEALDIQNRIVSLVHGIMCIVCCFYDLTYVKNEYGSENVGIENFNLVMSLGYFLYDTLAMQYYGLLDSPMLFHHSICCLGFYLSVCFNASAPEILAGMYISEISNPVMHVRLIIRNLGYRHTATYEVCEYSYILLYIYYRLLKGLFIVYSTITCTVGHPLIKLIAIGMAVQSYFYVIRMVTILKSRYKEMSTRRKEGVYLFWFSHNIQVDKLSYFKKSATKEAIP